MPEAPIRIEFQRSGGFAGIAMRSVLDTREMSPGEATALEQMVNGLDLAALHGRREAAAGGADRFQYDLVIARGDQRYEMSLPDSAVPGELRPLVDKMMDLARGG